MDKTVEIEVLPLYFDYVLNKDYPVVVLVGGRASGKSWFMEQIATINMNNKKNYKFLIVEDVETNIGEGVKAGIEQRSEEFGLDKYIRSTKQPPEITHKVTGNKVIFKGYHSAAQQKQVKSLNEITACWYEEGENITYEQFKALRMQLRGGDPKDRQLFITMNPIVTDGYINKEFFDKAPNRVIEYFEDGRPKVFERDITIEVDDETVTLTCLIIVSTHHDNKYLTLEQRADIEELKDTDIRMYQMLGEGKFIKPEGTFFKEFRTDIHVVEPFPIPEHWLKYTTKDYGLDMLANLWIAVDTKGNAWCYKAIHQSDLIISEAAKLIHEVNGDDKIVVKYGPPDMWNRRQETGKSAWSIFAENKEVFVKSDNNRVQGWLAMKEWLQVFEVRDEITGKLVKTSRMKFFSNCTDIIKNIPLLMRSESNPNDVGDKDHSITHDPDALRGFCIMRQRVPVVVTHKRDDYNLYKEPSKMGQADKSFLDY